MSTFKLQTSAAISKSIGNIGKASQKLTNLIQQCAVQIVVHAVRHGDVTLADSLVDALGTGMRRASLRAWFEKQGPFVFSTTDGKFMLDKTRRNALVNTSDAEIAEGADSIAWEEARPEKTPVSIFDVAEGFDKFMAKLDKLAASGNVEIRHRELLEQLRSVSAEYHSTKA